MWAHSKPVARLVSQLKPLGWVDLADEMQGADRGVSFSTTCRRFRVSVNRVSAPPEERTWILWDMRGQAKPWGPLDVTVSNPVLLEHGLPSLEKAKEVATIVATLWPVRVALTARTLVRGLGLRARMELMRRLLLVQAKLS